MKVILLMNFSCADWLLIIIEKNTYRMVGVTQQINRYELGQ